MKTKYGFNTTAARSALMSKIKSKDTKAEILIRKALWNLGYRYRLHNKKLPGKPDLVFSSQKVAVFIDGEFWHGYNWKKKKPLIKANRKYWIPKIEGNIARDKKTNRLLKKDGWVVLRFWEHQIKKDLQACTILIINHLECT